MSDQLTAREAAALDELDQMRTRAETAETELATRDDAVKALEQDLTRTRRQLRAAYNERGNGAPVDRDVHTARVHAGDGEPALPAVAPVARAARVGDAPGVSGASVGDGAGEASPSREIGSQPADVLATTRSERDVARLQLDRERDARVTWMRRAEQATAQRDDFHGALQIASAAADQLRAAACQALGLAERPADDTLAAQLAELREDHDHYRTELARVRHEFSEARRAGQAQVVRLQEQAQQARDQLHRTGAIVTAWRPIINAATNVRDAFRVLGTPMSNAHRTLVAAVDRVMEPEQLTDPDQVYRDAYRTGHEHGYGRGRLDAAGSLDEVAAERARQDAKWGQQNHPDGTGQWEHQKSSAILARRACQTAANGGDLTWRHILAEEVYEAFAEADPAKLRVELLQVAAVAVAWVEAIDRRTVPDTADQEPDLDPPTPAATFAAIGRKLAAGGIIPVGLPGIRHTAENDPDHDQQEADPDQYDPDDPDQCIECETTGRNCLAHSKPGRPGVSIHDTDDQEPDHDA